MLAVLSPYTQPRWGRYAIVGTEKTKLNDFFVTSTDPANTFSTQERFDLYTGMIYTQNEWWVNASETHYGVQFSGAYSFDLAYDESPAEVYEQLLNTKTPSWLDTASNTKLVIVTDGTCGSTCACFTMRGREANSGTYLFLGGNPLNDSHGTVASFAGGSVMSTSYTDLFDLT